MLNYKVISKSLIGGSLAISSIAAYAAPFMTSQNVEVVPGEMLVKFKSGAARSFFQKQGFTGGVYVDHSFKVANEMVYVVKSTNRSLSMVSVLGSLRSSPEVEIAEPNFIYRLIKPVESVSLESMLAPLDESSDPMTPNDPMFAKLWGMKNTGTNDPSGTAGVAGADINALKAWEITKGSPNVKVAIIDTGIDYNHPDLARNIWTNEAEANGKSGVDDDKNGYIDDVHGYDFANNDSDPMDGHSHGTHCAGTIGAVHNNEMGVAGVVDEVTLVPVKFLGDDGSGTSEAALKSIEYAIKLDVDVMSNSWGGGPFSQLLADMIQRASDAGIIFTAAAGNSSGDNDAVPTYPANYNSPNVISVAASTSADGMAYFSCYGKRSVDIAAPGHNIVSTVKGGAYASYSGTSMATPHVSGMLASLVSHVGRLPHEVMRERLLATSVPLRAFKGKVVSGGRVDLYNLLTDTRPVRFEPDPKKWVTVEMDAPFESAHPYLASTVMEKTITVPGAAWIRVNLKKYSTEARFDFIEIKNDKGVVVDKISGKGENSVSEYVDGESVTIRFVADRSVNDWGFLIDSYQVIMK